MLSSNELTNASIVSMLNKESVSIDEIQIIPHSFNIDELINNKVDVISAYATNQPGVLSNQGDFRSISLTPSITVLIFIGNNLFTSESELLNNPERSRDFIKASLKGWQYALDHPDEIIDLILKQYSTKKTLDDLKFEAKILEQFILPDFIPLGNIDKSRMQNNIEAYQQLGLLDSSFTMDGFLFSHYFDNAQSSSLFTKKELAWIESKKQLILGVDPNWRPFEFIDKDQTYKGMSADIIKLVSKKTGLTIKVQKNDTWSDVITSAKNKTLDILPAVMESPQRQKFLDFSTPHTVYPMVIVTTKDSSFISQLDELKGQKVVVVKGYVTEDIIRYNHPLLTLVTAKNIHEALTIIANGDAVAFVDKLSLDYHCDFNWWLYKLAYQRYDKL